MNLGIRKFFYDVLIFVKRQMLYGKPALRPQQRTRPSFNRDQVKATKYDANIRSCPNCKIIAKNVLGPSNTNSGAQIQTVKVIGMSRIVLSNSKKT
ncbi:Uncharacterized protein TCM_029252 [Theobroma cacao]|uniref:Uncharacterized protein n=1 Tax=Theobroma cacao TaxID=3641 RepID=A0A061GJX0_THECC|nr:Uncharacterized protein TCM_029252 [Theobroma cacao]